MFLLSALPAGPPGRLFEVAAGVGDDDGHEIGQTDPGEDPRHDAGGPEHARCRCVLRLNGSGRKKGKKRLNVYFLEDIILVRYIKT